jgi:hypothetical protein
MQVLPFYLAAGREEVSFSTSVDDTEYLFRVYWNPRDEDEEHGLEGAWYFDVSELDGTPGGTPVATGVKVVLGVFLARTTRHPLTRRGVLYALDTTGQGREATFDDLGWRVLLLWIPEVEVLGALQAIALERAAG